MKIPGKILFIFLLFAFFCKPVGCDTLIIRLDNQPFQSEMTDIERIKAGRLKDGIALALSGGGARGLAQIGVLEVLTENDIPIKFVTGTSMGAIIGGLYCAGYSPQELHRLALSIDWPELFASAPLRSAILVSAKGWPEKALLKLGIENWRPVLPKAITSAQKLSNLLSRLSYRAGVRASLNYDLLDPPFRATATDLGNGKLEIISRGDLAEALRAAMAFPVGFTPVLSDGRLLVDGGLVDPIPVDICLELSGRPVVAVNTTSPLLPVDDIEDAIDMANQSTTVMSLPRLQRSLEQADIVITPAIGFHKASDFSGIERLIEGGRQAAEQALPAIKNALIDEKPMPQGKRFFVVDSKIENLHWLPQSFFAKPLSLSGNSDESEIKARLEKAMAGGYLRDAYAEIALCGDSGRVVFRLEDYPRIKDINFVGVSLFGREVLLEAIESGPGQVANIKRLTEDLRRIEQLYAKAGYSLARAGLVDIDRSTGRVTIRVDEGRINDIRIEGNRRTRDWVVRRDLHFRVGRHFSEKKAERSLDDLYASGLFESVKLLAEPDSVGIKLVVKVEEKSFDYIRAGLRYDNEYHAQGFADLVFSNLMGAGNEFNVSNQFGEKKQAVWLNLKADRVFKTYITYRTSIYHSHFKRNSYVDHKLIGEFEETSTGAEIELGQQFPRLGKMSAVLSYSGNRFDSPLEERRFARIASVSFRSLVDTFDDVPFTKKGKYHYFDLEFAGDLLGGTMVFTRFYTVLEAYYPLGRKTNFHPRIALGLSNRLPPYFKLFDLGGRDTFYGLFDHEIMGENLLNGNLEIRQELLDNVYLSARYDIGNVWARNDSMKPRNFRHGGGLSLAVKTPIGPLGIAYGCSDKGNDAVYFYVGHDY